MTEPRPKVTVCVVSHDSARDLPDCLQAVAASSHRPLEVCVVDCASRDASAEVARRAAPASLAVEILPLLQNEGFAGGMNRALRHSDAPWVLSLNPDARPETDYIERLLAAVEGAADCRVGAVTGRLVRSLQAGAEPVLDACGMRLTLTWRHLDRGSGEADTGQYRRPERVFGATGAASLFNRQALNDVAVDGEVFASEFHSFREDAELCFRLQERGWEVLYEPAARCVHRRSNLPDRRRQMSPQINFHSLKNRYLLRAYHQDLPNFLMTLVPTASRDMMALIYVLAAERSSLAAYRWLWKRRREILARRRTLRQRRTSSTWALNRWFLQAGRPR